MAADEGVDRREVGLHLREGIAELCHPHDEQAVVGEGGRRLDGVAGALQAEHRVRGRYLPRRLRVPHRALPDRDAVHAAVAAHRRRAHREIRLDVGRLAGDRRIRHQLAAPHPHPELADGVVRDVRVHVVDVAVTEQIQRSAGLGHRCAGAASARGRGRGEDRRRCQCNQRHGRHLGRAPRSTAERHLRQRPVAHVPPQHSDHLSRSD